MANGEWLPYLSEDLKHYGVGSHIVSEAFENQGIKVQYHFLPWRRNFDTSKNGVYDGAILWAKVLDRDDYFIFSEGIVLNHSVYFHLKSKPFNFFQPEGLSHIRLGVISGYATGEYNPFKSIEAVKNEIQNIEKLLRGRIDVYLTDKAVGYFILNKYYGPEIVNQITHSVHLEETSSESYRMVLNRKLHNSTNIMSRFNHGLREMKKSGRYDELIRRFQNGDYETTAMKIQE